MANKLRTDWIETTRAGAAQDRKNAEASALKCTVDEFLRDRLVYLTTRWRTWDTLLPEDIETLRAAYIDGAGLAGMGSL